MCQSRCGEGSYYNLRREEDRLVFHASANYVHDCEVGISGTKKSAKGEKWKRRRKKNESENLNL